jgi:hypothetical protein
VKNPNIDNIFVFYGGFIFHLPGGGGGVPNERGGIGISNSS